MQVDAAAAAGYSGYRGITYYFCSTSCLAKFQADPATFVRIWS